MTTQPQTTTPLPIQAINEQQLSVAVAVYDRLRLAGRPILFHEGLLWWPTDPRARTFRPINPTTLRPILWQLLARVVTGNGPFRPSASKVTGVLDALLSVAQLRGEQSPIDHAPFKLPTPSDPEPTQPDHYNLISFRNGVLDVSTMTLDQEPRWFVTSTLSVDWDPDAPEPAEWLSVLGQQWGDDPDSIRSLRQWMGYTLVNDTRQQRGLYLLGPTRSSKSTIGLVTRSLHGKDSCVGGKFSKFGGEFALEPLIGKSLVIFPDARVGADSDLAAITENILEIIGEDELSINRKHQTIVGLKLPTRIMIISNGLVRLADASSAAAKRFVVLETRHSFAGHEDEEINGRLLAELPGIARWAIEGLRDLRASGRLLQPASSADRIGDAAARANPLIGFLDEAQVTLTEEPTTPPKVLYQRWRCYALSTHHQPGTPETFYSALRETLHQLGDPKQVRRNGERVRLYKLVIGYPCGVQCRTCPPPSIHLGPVTPGVTP